MSNLGIIAELSDEALGRFEDALNAALAEPSPRPPNPGNPGTPGPPRDPRDPREGGKGPKNIATDLEIGF